MTSSADTPESSSSEPSELLVAYLDGELDSGQSAAMEQRLREDPQLRQMADELDRTWGMLEALDTIAASEEFSRQTLETVAATVATETQSSGHSIRSLLRQLVSVPALIWFTVGVGGTAGGLALSAWTANDSPASQFYHELDMLQRYPRYAIIPDAAALQKLQLSGPRPSTAAASVSDPPGDH